MFLWGKEGDFTPKPPRCILYLEASMFVSLSTNLKEQRTPNNQTIFNNDIWLNFHHFMAIWHCVNIGEKKWELFFPFSKIGPKMKLKLA